MTIRDLIIIYLACGAPFAVYYFLQNRRFESTGILWIKTLIRFVFWIPFAIGMVARKSLFTNLYNHGFDRDPNSDAKRDAKIDEIRRFFDGFASNERVGLSVFEIREVFDRYVGLTLEVADADADPSAAEGEIFRITNHTSKKAGEACLHRRNLMRLSFHQKLAVADFAKLAARLLDATREAETLTARLNELTRLLGDKTTVGAITALAGGNKSPEAASNQIPGEGFLWISTKQNSPSESPSASLKSLTATMNLSAKD